MKKLVQIRLIFFLAVMAISQSLLAKTILMFVSHEDTYYSEYVVMKGALEAAGYTVEVRSSSTMDFSIYMVPSNTDIVETANTLSGSNYAQFQHQFSSLFGQDWNESLNAMPSALPVDGSILEVESMDSYSGLVVVGGTGALDYRVDGDYPSQGEGDRLLSSEVIQSVAEKLNELALSALSAGKPVMAQCHGASIPAFWRIPGTSGEGAEALGFSLLKGQSATGFPEENTGPTLTDLNVSFRSTDRVTVTGAHESFEGSDAAQYKIITTRDWYPQTVAYAARTFVNILESYPTETELNSEIPVLILHGGAVDEGNCSAGNKENDVPCNYGGGDNLPADYTHLVSLLEADGFNISITDVDLFDEANLPFDMNDEASVRTYLEDYEVTIFFKHWSNYLTDELQLAITDYVDDGGGLIGLHHALYNDIHNGQSKDILVDLFGAESSQSGWSANLTLYQIHNTNYGHFISTYQVDYPTSLGAPSVWSENALPNGANTGFSTLPALELYDEIYNNMVFNVGVEFGRGVNQITPLFSNGISPAAQSHTTGFTRLYNENGDDHTGKVVFMQIGERRENINGESVFGQIVRNAVMWASGDQKTPIGGGNANVLNIQSIKNPIKVYPNPSYDFISIDGDEIHEVRIYDLLGNLLNATNAHEHISIEHLDAGIYIANIHNLDGEHFTRKFVKR